MSIHLSIHRWPTLVHSSMTNFCSFINDQLLFIHRWPTFVHSSKTDFRSFIDDQLLFNHRWPTFVNSSMTDFCSFIDDRHLFIHQWPTLVHSSMTDFCSFIDDQLLFIHRCSLNPSLMHLMIRHQRKKSLTVSSRVGQWHKGYHPHPSMKVIWFGNVFLYGFFSSRERKSSFDIGLRIVWVPCDTIHGTNANLKPTHSANFMQDSKSLGILVLQIYPIK